MSVPKSFVISAMALLFFTSTAAFGQTVKTVSDFSDLVVVNACNGETIDVTGRTMTLTSSVVNNNGSHLLQKTLTWLRGTGRDSGVSYVGREMDSFLNNVVFGNELIAIVDTNLISQGSAPNVIFRQLLHITVNANGETTADILNSYTICTP